MDHQSFKTNLIAKLTNNVAKIYDCSPPPRPEYQLSALDLCPTLPILNISGDLGHDDMERYCARFPFTVIRGSIETFDINLGLFESKSLVELAPNFEVESYVYRAPRGIDVIRQETSTISEHAAYQSKFRGGDKEIKFGMLYLDQQEKGNLGFIEDELKKLPDFLQPSSRFDMLSYAGTKIGGINVGQLYMKVIGIRTGVHQEDVNLCSVNLNIGPASCTWYFVPAEYWSAMYEHAKRIGVDYFSRLWWPDVNGLRKDNIPVYVVEQKAGDIVYTSVGTPHWVEAMGITNNIAYNSAPQTDTQYVSMMERYRFNRMRQAKENVPVLHIIWNMARDAKNIRQGFHANLIDDLSDSLSEMLKVHAQLKSKIQFEKYDRNENEGYQYCDCCNAELFNFIFLPTRMSRKPRCWMCMKKTKMTSYKCLHEFDMDELIDTFVNFKKAYDVLDIGSELLTKKEPFWIES